MDFSLTAEQSAIHDMARAFGEAEIAPHARAWEAAGEIPKSLWSKVGDLGFGGIYVSEVHGGAGLSRLRWTTWSAKRAGGFPTRWRGSTAGG